MSLKKDLIDKQARFWVLMAGGATLTGASETVGVSRATGRKWRQATGGRIPRKRPEPSGRYLSLEERLQIADLHLGGAGVRAIAVGVGRSPATVSRELRRNGSAATPRRPLKYAPYAAQKQAELRGRRPKASKFDHLELADVGADTRTVDEGRGIGGHSRAHDRAQIQRSHRGVNQPAQGGKILEARSADSLDGGERQLLHGAVELVAHDAPNRQRLVERVSQDGLAGGPQEKGPGHRTAHDERAKDEHGQRQPPPEPHPSQHEAEISHEGYLITTTAALRCSLGSSPRIASRPPHPG
jgi:hypothetical protein